MNWIKSEKSSRKILFASICIFMSIVFSLIFLKMIFFNDSLHPKKISIDKTFNYTKNKLIVEIHLSDYKYVYFQNNADKTYSTIIYGNVVVENPLGSPVLFNLNNYFLIINDKKSRIYIDSYVDYIIRNDTLSPNKTYDYKVYWAFDGKLKPEEIDLVSLNDF